MKRALLALFLVASPAFAQANGWAEMANGWGEMQTVPGFAAIPPPASATLGCVGVFLGSPLALGCTDMVYTVANKSLDVTDGRVQAGNLRAIPLPASGAVTVEPKLSLIGGITVVAGSALVDGDSLSVGDGVGVVPLEFDAAPGDGTTGGAVPIIFDGTETATQIRDAVKAILDAATRDWITSNQGADGIGLVRATPGASGGAITEAVADAGFTVNDWTAPTAATTYTYSLQACLADGTCNAAGAASSTAAGVMTLSAYNLNRLSWSAVSGAASYKIRRDVGGATQGVIWAGTALTVDDVGLAGDGSAKPTADGTGRITSGALTSGRVAIVGTDGLIEDDAGLTYNATTDTLTSGRVLVGNGGSASPSIAAATGAGLYFTAGKVFFSTGAVGLGSIESTGWFPATSLYVPAGSEIGVFGRWVLTSPAAATLQLGAADAASPVAQVLKFQDATGTNANAAATATVKCPAGTGTGTPGACVFQAPVGGSSGSTAHTQTAALKIIGAASGGVPGVVLAATQSPASNAACEAGTITWDASYIYICTASGAWKRAALTGGY